MASFGVIFDADGVLLNSERQSLTALRLAIQTITSGTVSLPPDSFDFFCGRDDMSILDLLPKNYGLTVDPQEFLDCKIECYRRAIARDPIALASGALELLDRLDAAGIPYAIATSAIRAKLDISLRAVGLTGRFGVIATADDVRAGKPDPAVFLVTAKRLGLHPRRLMVFEDSINGIEAANRAGMVSLGVVGSFSRDQLSQARHTVEHLGQVSVPLLHRWIE